MQHRRALSSSPRGNKRSQDSNFEYQSEDSESDSTSTSSQEGEVYESCSKVEVEGRVKKSKRLSPFPETRVVQALFEYFIDFVFSITRLFENINRILFIAVLVLAVHYIANLWLSNHDAIPQEKAQMRLRAFENELSKFATEFGNITREELRFLFHVGRQWFLMLQKSPVVLIIAGDESEHVARALSDVFCAAFHISSPVVTFNLSSASVRSELHDRLDRAVHSTFPLAVLNGVDHLGWDAPLVLHAFADDSSMAPPHTLLFLTIKKAFDSSKIDCEQSVMEYLSARWIDTGGSVDNVSPILSRIMQFLICL